MSRIELLPGTALDFARILDHLAAFEVIDGVARIEEILAAIDVLAANPRIGRPVEGDKRELVIGRGSRGYLALYTYHELEDLVTVQAVRHQSEAEFRES